jgi:hypothetical protein
MIDSTKAPVSARRKAALTALLVVLLAVAGYVLWTKDLHHSNPGSPASAPPAASAPRRSASVPTTATTIPGGLPESSRDPFASGN